MKFYLFALFILSFTTINAQVNNLPKKYVFEENIKIEDEKGKLITDSVRRIEYLIKKQKRIENNILNNSKASTLTPVPLCINGSFEQFQTILGSNVLSDFEYAVTELDNPIQCKSPSVNANQSIVEYNPSNFDIMATTVPSNFLDEYIGNINAFDQFALKINYKNSSSTVSLIQAKRFKTDNETTLKFNYKAVLQSVLGTAHENEQPFFKARVINNAGIVVSEFCIIADPNNCIFTQAPFLDGDSVVMYTQNWQSGILDISSIPNNQNFTVEFFASRCGLGGHFGYAYIDDICLLHGSENLQGSVELDPLYEICPTLPFSICGDFTTPNSGGINATINTVSLNIYNASNSIVYTSQAPSSLNLNTKRFCFEILSANLPDITTGKYNVSVTIDYGITQTNCSGTSFSSVTDYDANPGWDIWFLNCTNCNINLNTAEITLCDNNHNGKEFFNLTNFNPLIVSNVSGLTFTYYPTLADATNNTNAITAITNYESESSTIFIRVIENATCYKIIPVKLVVKYPIATISGILNVCDGSTTLTASNGASYLWGNNQTTQSIIVTSIGTYTVTVTDVFGCTSTGSVTILNSQVAAQPNIVVTQPTCSLSTGKIEITSPALEYSFDNGSTWSSNSILNNVSVGSYIIKIKTIAGCFSYPVTINIFPFLSSFPFYNAVSPSFCGGFGSITITSTAQEYSFDDGVTWSTNNIATNLPSGTYLIRTKDNFGCISNFNSVTLNSEFLAAPLYTFDNPYCGNLGSITITTPAQEYSFDGGTTWQNSNILNNLTDGSYIIKIKDSQGCTSPNVYVYLNALEFTYPQYQITNAGCGTYASITITTIGDEYSFDGGITWSTNPTLSNLNGGTNYQLKVRKGTCNSYHNYAYIYSYYYPLPTPNDFQTTLCDDLNDGSENLDLTLYNQNLISNSSNYSFSYYTSLLGAENNIYSDVINDYNSHNLSNLNNTVYVRVTSLNGCYAVAKIEFNFIDSPIINLEEKYPLCEFKNITVDAGIGYDSYLWSTGETSQSIIITNDGDYWLTVTENHGTLICNSTKTFNVFLSNPAVITHVDTIDWTDTENQIEIYVSGLGEYEYSIDGTHYQDENTFSNLISGNYYIYIRDKYNCGTVTSKVFLLNYPKYFTPNGDGFNDYWKIKFSEVEPNLSIKIFDRFGKVITILNSNSQGWDGTYNEKPIISDDYWFIVTRENGKEYKGHFSLKR